MSETSPNLNLPYLQPNQAQKHVTHNLALQMLDALTQLRAQAVDATMPPALPEEGEIWITGAFPTGDWAGHAEEIAVWTNGSWMFLPLLEGVVAFDLGTDQLLVRNAGIWVLVGGAAMQPILGVNASADTVNRLAVAAEATLFSHDGSGHQMKLNKSGAGDTASLLYQTGFSGRAEMGLAGSDNWSIKVSPDGANWTTALEVDAGDGLVTGAAIQADATDVGTGKLARADFTYGPGNLLGQVSETAGVPTGAVIERGANANGTYIRFADGTQICTFKWADAGLCL